MARTLDAFPDEKEQVKRGRYPWDQWLDGQTWELKKGSRQEVEEGKADFAVTAKSFRSAVMQAASQRNGEARTATLDDGNVLVIEFVQKDRGDSHVLSEEESDSTDED